MHAWAVRCHTAGVAADTAVVIGGVALVDYDVDDALDLEPELAVIVELLMHSEVNEEELSTRSSRRTR